MKLAKLRLRNFRCYKDEISIPFNDVTAFVGRNDAGKSTVMDALDIFLNDGAPDRYDATKGGDGKNLTIICEFDETPSSIVLDEDVPTSLALEHLLNPEGRLEIHKTYSGHTSKPGCTGIFAYAVHPTAEGASDLLLLKNADLKKRAKEVGADMNGIDQKINAALRARIRAKIGDLKLAPILVRLDGEGDNMKKTWEGLRIHLPVFALFKSDRASTDQDPEAQDPLKIAVREALKSKEAELNAIITHVETEVRKTADKTLEKLREMDQTLASQLNPQFAAPKWDTLFKATITGDDDIPINKRGSGVKRLILLNFFRAKAEIQSKERTAGGVIYGIEEPETSQHPHNQRLLVNALLELATEGQVVLTTHTPMLARALPDDCLRYVSLKPDLSREVLIGGVNTNQLFAKSLGVLPDNLVKLFIGVEGRHDIACLKNFSKILRAAGEDVLDLDKMELAGELIFFPLGGSSLALWTSRLQPLGRPELHLYDRDSPAGAPAKYQNEADAVNLRDRCKAIITQKREMENYIHYEAINESYATDGINLGLAANHLDFDDVPVTIAQLVHATSGSPKAWAALDEDEREKKESRAKVRLNSIASSRMTKARLQQIDPNGEVLSWFAAMRALSALA